MYRYWSSLPDSELLFISDHYFVGDVLEYCPALSDGIADYQAAVDTYNLNYGVYLLQEELADQACEEHLHTLEFSAYEA